MVKATLETVTPLFLGGADPRGAPELRAASVRGALRFWLRALLGGIIGDDKLNDLRKAESAVFGSTEGASPVVVRLQHGSLQTQRFSQLAANKAGVSYLFFAARGTRQESERMAIKAGTSFELTLSAPRGIKTSGEVLRPAYAALWLLTHLGGLGARSRRGAGSLQVREAMGEPNGLPSLIVCANSPAKLREELKEGLTRLRQLMHVSSSFSISSPSAFDVLHPSVCKIWVIDRPFKSWEEALDAIGQAMQLFRYKRQPDYGNVKAVIQGRRLSQPVQQAAFGLPIVFFYSSLYQQYQKKGDDQRTARYKATGTLGGQHHSRRASPLLIRVTKLANGHHAIVLTLFCAQLLEENEKLKLERGGLSCMVNPPDLSLIDDFLNDLDNKVAQRLEVTGW